MIWICTIRYHLQIGHQENTYIYLETHSHMGLNNIWTGNFHVLVLTPIPPLENDAIPFSLLLDTLWCKPASRHHDLWLVVGGDAAGTFTYVSFLSMYNTIISSAPYLSSAPIFNASIPTRGINLAGDHTTIRTHSQLFTSVILNINSTAMMLLFLEINDVASTLKLLLWV